MGFLVGMGGEEPLRYRLLPVDRFMNVGTSITIIELSRNPDVINVDCIHKSLVASHSAKAKDEYADISITCLCWPANEYDQNDICILQRCGNRGMPLIYRCGQ